MTRDEAISIASDYLMTTSPDPEDLIAFRVDLGRAGFAIVPLEPTEKMQEAGRVAQGGFVRCGLADGGYLPISGDSIASIYRAMIAAYDKEESND